METNKHIVRRLVSEAQQGRDVSVVDELLSPNFVDHSPMPGVEPTRDGVKILFGALHAAFPDLTVTIHDQIAEGDKVVTHKTFTGTHRGDFLGIPASGNAIDFEVIDILRVRGEKITDHWAVIDKLTLMKQLGAVQS